MDQAAAQQFSLESYLNGRWQSQVEYAERKASINQRLYLRMNNIIFICSILTPVSIFIQLLIPEYYRPSYSLLPILLSTATIGSYQWEDQHHYGAQWTKFRLLAERLRRHRELVLYRAGTYRGLDEDEARTKFVAFCEGLLEGTDTNYFELMVDPSDKPIAATGDEI